MPNITVVTIVAVGTLVVTTGRANQAQLEKLDDGQCNWLKSNLCIFFSVYLPYCM